ncbi:subtilisin-like protein [Lactarius akahatsu]|uniref:tripeptidyl-peptidase II n=1 Tax=Lactarius akahatsu TaxID=416441 RepID=A0AAD4LHV3_9AGAM|nr:subtilisin-like protein [Lactarius akahatsu]
MVNVLTVLPSFFSLVLASSYFERHMRLHERRDGVPEGFTNKGPAPGDVTLRFRIALVQNDTQGLQTKLMDVSTPRSPQYGQWLSKEEVGTFVTPKRETATAVNEWLATNGLNATVLSPFGDWIGFETTVSHANVLFDADFSTFVHDGSGKSAIRTLAYSIPASLTAHLQLIHPTISFPAPNDVGQPVLRSLAKNVLRRNITSAVTPSTLCDAVMTPECVQLLYKIPGTLASQSSNKLAAQASFKNLQIGPISGLLEILEIYRTDLSPDKTFTLQTIDGGTNSQTLDEAGVEADLDVQYTIGLASGVPTVFISVGDQYQDGDLEGFLDIINFLSGKSAPPQVLTTSYGQDENTISRALAYRLCNAYASLSARGVSILFSSGDGGVSGSQSQSCTTFVPTFPSGCPFVTSVGGTQNFNPETSAPFSSGGFSNYFDTPWYQTTAKAAYLTKLGSTYAGRFNASGRGFPDVSAAGTNLEIVWRGSVMNVDGTSCSSPVFASVVSLLNDRLIAAGKPVLGFLNPFLYSTGADALNDITTGGNPGCNTNGFPAMAGWDPITGLGTPNWAKLLAAAGL